MYFFNILSTLFEGEISNIRFISYRIFLSRLSIMNQNLNQKHCCHQNLFASKFFSQKPIAAECLRYSKCLLFADGLKFYHRIENVREYANMFKMISMPFNSRVSRMIFVSVLENVPEKAIRK